MGSGVGPRFTKTRPQDCNFAPRLRRGAPDHPARGAPGRMHLMYYDGPDGKRVYSLKVRAAVACRRVMGWEGTSGCCGAMGPADAATTAAQCPPLTPCNPARVKTSACAVTGAVWHLLALQQPTADGCRSSRAVAQPVPRCLSHSLPNSRATPPPPPPHPNPTVLSYPRRRRPLMAAPPSLRTLVSSRK